MRKLRVRENFHRRRTRNVGKRDGETVAMRRDTGRTFYSPVLAFAAIFHCERCSSVWLRAAARETEIRRNANAAAAATAAAAAANSARLTTGQSAQLYFFSSAISFSYV